MSKIFIVTTWPRQRSHLNSTQWEELPLSPPPSSPEPSPPPTAASVLASASASASPLPQPSTTTRGFSRWRSTEVAVARGVRTPAGGVNHRREFCLSVSPGLWSPSPPPKRSTRRSHRRRNSFPRTWFFTSTKLAPSAIKLKVWISFYFNFFEIIFCIKFIASKFLNCWFVLLWIVCVIFYVWNCIYRVCLHFVRNGWWRLEERKEKEKKLGFFFGWKKKNIEESKSIVPVWFG